MTDRDGHAIQTLEPSDFIVKEDGVAQAVETAQFIRLDGGVPEDLKESIEIRSPDHARVQAARDDVRLFVLFLDDYHIDKAPQIMVPLRRTLRAFVEKLGPYDLVAIVDPLTPVTHIEFTRDRNAMLERVSKVEGPSWRAVSGPKRRRRDAANAAQRLGAACWRDARCRECRRDAPGRAA